MTVDLHIHTTFSDGKLTPTEIVALAVRKKMTTIAITDHDTMAGVGEAMAAAADTGLEVIPGIEISSNYEGADVHVLGYWMNQDNLALHEALTRLQQGREKRNRSMLEKLGALGISISFEELQALSGSGQTGRPHIAQLLVRHGAVKSVSDAFRRYLKKGSPAYASRFIFSTLDSIRLIRDAGGIAVLAHPQQVDKTLTMVPRMVRECVQVGLGGMEVYHPSHTSQGKKKLRNLAEKHKLFITGGSDFHGDAKHGPTLARERNIFVPEENVVKMKEYLGLEG